MRFGLDFGTSNTSLALWTEREGMRLLPLDPVAGEVMPTVLYVRRDASTAVGRSAIDAYLADNVARGPVRRSLKLLGVRVPSSVPGVEPVEAHILADVDALGRLFQSLKSFLGDPLVASTNVFGTQHDLAALIALILVAVRDRAAALTGVAPTEITIGRPVRFIGDDAAEPRALERLRHAAELAGFREARFVYEPVAAAHAADVVDGISLVFDFGGGTLDLCLVRRGPRGLDVLATAGGGIGGDRCTELLIDEFVAPRLGARAAWGPKQLRLPAVIVNAIRDWHALSALNEKWLLDALDDLIAAGAPRRELAALKSAIELQLGYEIFATVDAAKCRLSSSTAAVVTYHRAAVDVDARVTRPRFELLIATLLRRIDELLDEVLRSGEVRASDVVEVVCTGGSSAIPAARALLRRRFPQARLRDAAALTSVAAGLALPDVPAAPVR